MIEYIKLHGYKRFTLAGNHEFELKIDSMVVVVLGTNGSGKSALLAQLTPYPPSPGEFEKTGCKETHHLFRGKRYVLKAIFSPQPRYYFECDGQALNAWGTQSIQKALVEEHFNLNSKTVELMKGGSLFSEMSLTERKDWIVALSGSDYDYAVSLYNKAREKQRDLQGAIKISKKSLSAETDKRIGNTEFETLRQQARELELALDGLYEGKPKADLTLDVLDQQLEAQAKKIAQVISSLEKAEEKIKPLRRTVDDYKATAESCQSKIYGLKMLIASSEKEFTKNQNTITVLEKAKSSTVEDLQSQAKSLGDELQILSNGLFSIPEDRTNAVWLEQFEAISPSITGILLSIPDNREKLFGFNQLDKAKEDLVVLKRKQQLYMTEHDKIQAKLEHLDEHREKRDIVCPKCAHEHSTVYDEKQFQSLLTRDKNAVEHLNTLRREIETKENFIQECVEYVTQFKNWLYIKQSNPFLKPWLDWLEDNGLLSDNPKAKTHLLRKVFEQLSSLFQYTKLEQKYNDTVTLLKQLQEVSSGDNPGSLQLVQQRQEQLSKDISRANRQITIHQQKRTQALAIVDLLYARLDLLDTLGMLSAQHHDTFEDKLHTIRCEHYNALIRQVQQLLASKQHILTQAKHQQSLISSLQNQLTTMVAEEKTYDLLACELSPKTGMIAEGLYAFIEQFFNDINSIIEQVWTYSMKLLPRSEQEVEGVLELDYRFPVEIIKTERIELKDVSHGEGASKGQKEMIDLAFMVMAMSYLRLTEFPLFLDEIGSRFDDEHKKNLIVLLKQLVDSRAFPQIFMVSHDFFQYTALNAQMVVLDSSNIKLK